MDSPERKPAITVPGLQDSLVSASPFDRVYDTLSPIKPTKTVHSHTYQHHYDDCGGQPLQSPPIFSPRRSKRVTRAGQLAEGSEGSRLHFPLKWESGDPQTPPRRAFEIGRALFAAMQSGKLEERNRTLIPCTGGGDEVGIFMDDRAALEQALDGHGGIGEFAVAFPESQAACVPPTSFIQFLSVTSGDVSDELDINVRPEEQLPCSQSHSDSPPNGGLRDLMDPASNSLGHGNAPSAIVGSMEEGTPAARGGEMGRRRSKKAAAKAQPVETRTVATSQSILNGEAKLASDWLDLTSPRANQQALRQGERAEGVAGLSQTYDISSNLSEAVHDTAEDFLKTDRTCSPSDAAGTYHVLHLNSLRGGGGEVDVTILPNDRSHSTALSRVVKVDAVCVTHFSSREGSAADDQVLHLSFTAAEGTSTGALKDLRPTFKSSQRLPGSGGPHRSGGKSQKVHMRKSLDGCDDGAASGYEAGDKVYSPSEPGKRLLGDLDAMQSQPMASEDSGYSSDRKERRNPEDGGACRKCSCRKSRCLKLYCECFRSNVYCQGGCKCGECLNIPENAALVQETRDKIAAKNPDAFHPRIVAASPSKNQLETEGDDLSPAHSRHKSGCHCKKSMCTKKYCECYQAGVGCMAGCKCDNCANPHGLNSGTSTVPPRRPDASFPPDFLYPYSMQPQLPHHHSPTTPFRPPRDSSTTSSKRLSLDAPPCPPPLKRKLLSPPRYEVGGTETPVQYPPAWPIPSLSATETGTGERKRQSFGSLADNDPGEGRLRLPSSSSGGLVTPALFRKPAPRSPTSITTSRQRRVAKQALRGAAQESFPSGSPLDPDQFFGLTPTKARPPPSVRQSDHSLGDDVAWGGSVEGDQTPPRMLLPSNSLSNKRVSPSKMPRAREEADTDIDYGCPGLLSP